MCATHFGSHCEQNDWQTGVKTLPCPKLHLRAVIRRSKEEKNEDTCSLALTSEIPQEIPKQNNKCEINVKSNAIDPLDTDDDTSEALAKSVSHSK